MRLIISIKIINLIYPNFSFLAIEYYCEHIGKTIMDPVQIMTNSVRSVLLSRANFLHEGAV
jgi:hypothetical protein